MVVQTAISQPAVTRISPWASAFAALYDPFVWVGERSGLRALRAEQLGRARGRTVEIGAGTGLNLPYYPEHLEELILLEPDAAMRSRLSRRRADSRARAVGVVDGSAERLPFADRSIDTIVSTLVLCTVDAPDLALREIVRVLRPGGQLLFIEHVRSESATLARWQDLLAAPWQRFAAGCRCNRAMGQLIADCGLAPEPLRQAAWRGMPPIVRPLIVGRACRHE